jgi:hypothetical protein
MRKWQEKVVMILSFEVREVIITEWLIDGQNFNEMCYLEILTDVWQRIRANKPELWNEKPEILHKGKGPAYSAPSVTQLQYWNAY